MAQYDPEWKFVESFLNDPEGTFVSAADLSFRRPYSHIWSVVAGQLLPTYAGIEYRYNNPCSHPTGIKPKFRFSDAYIEIAENVIEKSLSLTLLMFETDIAKAGDNASAIHQQIGNFIPTEEAFCPAKIYRSSRDSLERHPELEPYTTSLSEHFTEQYGDVLDRHNYATTKTIALNTAGFCIATLDTILSLATAEVK